MKRFGIRFVHTATVTLIAASLAACGGGSHGAVPPATGGGGASYTGQLSNATFVFTIPAPPKTTATTRAPKYISAATKSIRIDMTSSTRIASPGSQFNVLTPVSNGSGSSPGSPCSGSGPWTCTISIQIPPGNDTFTFTAYDDSAGAGHVLSQQIQTLAVVAGQANSFNVTFDANANAMAITATAGYCAGTVTVTSGQTIPTVGTTPVTFTTSYTDAAGSAVTGPGYPLLEIQGNDNAYHSTTGTINGTGGTVSFAINQSTQTFTLTASSSSVTGATVKVQAVPPNSDGLSFSQSLSFNFTSGAGEPANFLTVIEQPNGSGNGTIAFYTYNTSSETFGTTSPASLSATTPTGSPNNEPDVDFPVDLTFDGNGDLLIANGGGLEGSGTDVGNFACIPAGDVTTGANAATVLTNGLDEPFHIALMSDQSVAIGNEHVYNSSFNNPDVQGFVLSGTYTASSARSISTYPNYATLGLAVPTPDGSNPAGTYVAAIGDSSADSTSSHLVWLRPGAGNMDTTYAQMAYPQIAYDPANNQIVEADGNTPGGASATTAYLQFINADNGTVTQSLTLDDDGCYQGGATPYAGCPPQGSNSPNGISDTLAQGAAASSLGYVAVMGEDIQNGQSIWIYDKTSGSRQTIGGPIPFSAMSSTAGVGSAPYTYGGSSNGQPEPPIISAFRWVNGTQLMVSLRSPYGTSSQGIYVFDVTKPLAQMCTCYDGYGNQFPKSLAKVAFLNITAQQPFSFAYKP